MSLQTTYPIDGSNKTENRVVQKDWDLYDEENRIGRIWINERQYFSGIPLEVWEARISGYQPAQKWLKGRSSSTLHFDDVLNYQKNTCCIA